MKNLINEKKMKLSYRNIWRFHFFIVYLLKINKI